MGKRRKSKQNKKRTSKPRANWISTAVLRSLVEEAKPFINPADARKFPSLTKLVCEAVRQLLDELERQPVEPATVGAVTA